jgi:hypothetical protein
MIHIFFDCGSFGSTVEYVIRNFTDHPLGPVSADILPDGSMHSFRKQNHIAENNELVDFLSNNFDINTITTPTYPFKEYKFDKIIDYFSSIPTWTTDSKILIYTPDLAASELNLLFKYHKVCAGSVVKSGLDIIVGDNRHNLSGWSRDYTHWSQMALWELREWLSLFYPGWTQEFVNTQHHVNDTWLKIFNTDILYDTESTLNKLIDFCKLTVKPGLAEFVQEWQSKQQYIVDEFNLLDQIIDSTITQQTLTWQPINIVAEAIVQQRLRAKGYEIRCDGLNIFPTDSTTLYNLLEKV